MRIDPQALVIPLKVTLGGAAGEAEIEMDLDTGSTYTLTCNIDRGHSYKKATFEFFDLLLRKIYTSWSIWPAWKP